MQKLIINGGKRLRGELSLQGAKNAVLPILAAAALCDGEVTLKNCPRLSDTYAAMRILNSLGRKTTFEANTITVDGAGISETQISESLMREMRSSVIFLGAVLGKTGNCKISLPGGCDIGARPIDMHISALKKMGAVVTESGAGLSCESAGRLKGAEISLFFPSVGATENIILAAVLSEGVTVIHNAAREPEITDLIYFLRKCGAQIEGAQTGSLVINGVERLHGCEYEIMPDRIVCATYMACAAAAGGDIVIRNCRPAHLTAVTPVFEQMGCAVHSLKNTIYFSSGKRLNAIDIVRTMVYPGFPTDAQAFVMAALCKADGASVFVENIFENRYRHVGGLRRMGADIQVEGKVAVVKGTPRLFGANCSAPDLRGGAGLVAAALGAEGRSEISSVRYIDRGYEAIEATLSSLGADIVRV
ncbi:MAG: UDP-N-acetylglucosamine 1-carboxyvinyltransferase [Oscillospiraceae bacterium]|nr:UDP-N-acetylglucosamine 1-carboxyvinyltransferase [Oscillospiraceae bacterium]